MAEQKDTIYIDIDDEITSIIEKVRGSKNKILALVLPKRATTLQSIVNMKLLKRTADESKKNLVLITSEAGLLPLAGAVGLHVAKTLQSKPAIPPPPDMSKVEESIVDTEVPGDEPELDDSKSIGELAGLPDEPEAPAVVAAAEETIDIDNTDDAAEGAKEDKAGKNKSKSKIKIPNFNKFRLRLILAGIGLIALIVLWFIAFRVLPKATVTIQTDNQSVNDSSSFTANTDAKTVDVTNKIVPAIVKDDKITATQTAASTGKKNNGNKASGTINVSTVCTVPPGPIPAGTAATASGLTFITTKELDLNSLSISGGHIICSGNVPLIASQGGSNYNLAASSSFTISGYSGTNSDPTAGGSDDIVTILSQADIDGAKQKVAANTTQAQSDLTKALTTAGEQPIAATLVADDPIVSTSANAGDQVSQVIVTVVTTYHMLGIKQADLQKIVANDVKDKIDTTKQSISDYGLNGATYALTTKTTATNQTLSLQTTVTTGAQIDTATLKQQIAGMKKGDISQLIGALPSVKTVTVDYSPFWVTTTPHKTSRITIVVQKSNTSSNGK